MNEELEVEEFAVDGALPFTYWTISGHEVARTAGGVIAESTVSIYVNGQEVATVMCSPLDQEALALGFLYNEGIIESLAEVALMQANNNRSGVDIFLHRSEFSPPRRMILTSGCGGGITLGALTENYPPLTSPFTTPAATIFARMRDLHGAAQLYNAVRGVHTAVLCDTEKLLFAAEDVGRHNTIDKLAGKALQADKDTHDCLLLTSGRISSEMLTKARRLHIPLVASRTAPTSTALALAQAWQICLVGYVRGGSLRVYTHPWRLQIEAG